jgi:hypothetical protein
MPKDEVGTGADVQKFSIQNTKKTEMLLLKKSAVASVISPPGISHGEYDNDTFEDNKSVEYEAPKVVLVNDKSSSLLKV